MQPTSKPMRSYHYVATFIFMGMFIIGCNENKPTANNTNDLSAQAKLGESIFNDVTLSASGKQACSSCHVNKTGDAQDNNLPAQLGGEKLNLQGGRIAPSVRYLAYNTAFSFDKTGTPTGGFFLDGRTNSLMEQAGKPFLNPIEMANINVADVVAKVAKASYANDFKAIFGEDIFSQPDSAFKGITLALQQFEQSTLFRPFSSKFDDYLRGTTLLNVQELRGFVLFNNPNKGNCASCHTSTIAADGTHPLFTDFTYDSLGVPRNNDLIQNNDPDFYDLGLCERTNNGVQDLIERQDLCGAFKVPSLRNVALRKVFFHNGKFKTLKDTLTFYVQRDTNPEKFYPINADGSINKFNDLPLQYKRNVNTTEAPYNRNIGMQPALNDSEIDDVIAFLNTLTDR